MDQAIENLVKFLDNSTPETARWIWKCLCDSEQPTDKVEFAKRLIDECRGFKEDPVVTVNRIIDWSLDQENINAIGE